MNPANTFDLALEKERGFLQTYLVSKDLRSLLERDFSDCNYNGMQLEDRKRLSAELLALFPKLPPEHRADAMRVRGKIDLYFLCTGLLGFTDLTPRTHGSFCKFLESPRWSRKLAMLPRGYFKTTISTISRSVQMLLNQPTLRILVANSTQTNASKFLLKIENIFESNELIRGLYPELVPKNFRSVRWNSNEMELQRPETFPEASIEAIGVGGTAVSRHYDVILKDDLVNEDQILSRDQMEKVIEWNRYAESLFVNLTKAIDIHVGTRWAYYDVLSHVMETDKSYKIFNLSCWEVPEKVSTFPERFPPEVLKAIRERQGRLIFACMYENNPLPSETQIFDTSLIHRFKGHDPGIDLDYHVAIIVDPALGEEGSTSDTGIIVEGWGKKGERVVFDALPLQERPSEYLPRILNLADEYELLGFLPTIWLEGVLFQRVLKTIFEDEMTKRGKYYMVDVLKTSTHKTKPQRIEAFEAPVSAGKVYVREGLDEIMNQLDTYPAGKKRDLLDALAYGETVMPAGIHTYGRSEGRQATGGIYDFDTIYKELMSKYRKGQGLFTQQLRSMARAQV